MSLDNIKTNILTAVVTVLVGGIGMIVYDHFTTDDELAIEQTRVAALEQLAAQGIITTRKLTEVSEQNSRSLTSLATGRAADTLEKNYKLIGQFEAKYGSLDFDEWNEQDQSRYLAAQAAVNDAIMLVTNGL